MTQRKARSAPVVAAGAVVAVAAADVVRRKWQGRAALTPAPGFAPAQPPRPTAVAASPGLGNEAAISSPANEPAPTPEPSPPPSPKHRAAELEAEVSQVSGPDSAAPEPETLESSAPPTPARDAGALSDAESEAPSDPMDPAEPQPAEAPNWWHRGHPTFSALTGFFAGIAFLVVVPGLYAGILAQLVDYERAEQLFPFVLLTLIVPLVLLTIGKTRRFAFFMLIGLFSTLVVVGGVTALVLYVLFAMN
ncbi:hypothetical protein GCM10027020_01780 [Nocardioides salsibiostraticola]